jgi:hypothetical protein
VHAGRKYVPEGKNWKRHKGRSFPQDTACACIATCGPTWRPVSSLERFPDVIARMLILIGNIFVSFAVLDAVGHAEHDVVANVNTLVQGFSRLNGTTGSNHVDDSSLEFGPDISVRSIPMGVQIPKWNHHIVV